MVTQLPANADHKASFTHLQVGLIEYASRVEDLHSTCDVLDQLHAITTKALPLSVLGAARFPLQCGDWNSLHLGKSIFLHKDVPNGWWEEYTTLGRGRFRPMLFLAQSSMASYTSTEVRRMLQPIGVDQWSYELSLKYGMRDGLTCPVGGRWVVAFWSGADLSKVLTRPMRVLIVAAASFAALRLEQLSNPDPRRLGSRRRLTPREAAVLRLVSTGARSQDVAHALGLGNETVRTYLKNVQTKLGVRNRTQAVAEALRQQLIP